MSKIKQGDYVLFFYDDSKKWLLKVAKKVETNANKYNIQLHQCEIQLNKKNLFGIF